MSHAPCRKQPRRPQCKRPIVACENRRREQAPKDWCFPARLRAELALLKTTFYAEGVAQHSPGSRQRTLGEEPEQGSSTPKGLHTLSQGALTRPGLRCGTFYAEGVAQHSPGSRQRTLGEKPQQVSSTPKGLHTLSQGALTRPGLRCGTPSA